MDKSVSVAVMYLLTHIAITFFLYPVEMIQAATGGHWFPVLIGYLFHFTIIAVYMKGLSYFNNQDIVDISLSNKWLAPIILLPVTIYLLVLSVLCIRSMSQIITIVYLSKTPLWAVMILFLLISAYLASLGPKSLFRAGVLITIVFMPLVLLVLFSSFQNIDWRYIFPLFDRKLLSFSFLHSKSYYESGFAFTGAFIFLGMIPPYLPYKPKKILLSSLILLPMFLMAVYLPVMCFGEATASQFQFPFIVCLDTVEIHWLMFDRITIFFLQCLASFVMLLIALVLWEATAIINKTVIKVNPLYVLGGIGVAVFIACLLFPDWNDVQQASYLNSFLRWYIVTVLPFSILVMGIVRNRKVRMKTN